MNGVVWHDISDTIWFLCLATALSHETTLELVSSRLFHSFYAFYSPRLWIQPTSHLWTYVPRGDMMYFRWSLNKKSHVGSGIGVCIYSIQNLKWGIELYRPICKGPVTITFLSSCFTCFLMLSLFMYVLGAYGRSWGPTVGCIHPKTGHGTHPLFNRDNMVVEQLRMAPRAGHVTLSFNRIFGRDLTLFYNTCISCA